MGAFLALLVPGVRMGGGSAVISTVGLRLVTLKGWDGTAPILSGYDRTQPTLKGYDRTKNSLEGDN